MKNCTQESFEFPVCKRRQVEANFKGGDITSDGCVLLLRQVDRCLGLSAAVSRAPDDPRRRVGCTHDGLGLVRQRLYALALGYKDLNDHETLRLDLALQTALDRDGVLAGSSTLCRYLLRILFPAQAFPAQEGRTPVSRATQEQLPRSNCRERLRRQSRGAITEDARSDCR